MHDALIEEIIKERKERKPFSLERTPPEQETRDFYMSRFADHVSAALKPQVDAMRYRAEVSDTGSQSLSTSRELGGLLTEVQLRNHFAERLRVELDRPMMPLEFTVPSGTSTFSPPYDEEWQIGGGVAFGASQNGRFDSISKPHEESNAGVGFYLSSNSNVDTVVAITPLGSYRWSWFGSGDLPSLESRGGLGYTVYKEGQEEPLGMNTATLFSVSGVWGSNYGGEGSGKLEKAVSLTSDEEPFAFRLFPVGLRMRPDHKYLIQVWVWQTLVPGPTGDGPVLDPPFLGILNVEMPFVEVATDVQILW
jgi:hypothetical protein